MVVPVKAGAGVVEIQEPYCCFAFLLQMEILQMVVWLQWTVCYELCWSLEAFPVVLTPYFKDCSGRVSFKLLKLLLLWFFFSFCSTVGFTFSSFTHVIWSAHTALPVFWGRENLNFCSSVLQWLENAWCTDRKGTTEETIILQTLGYKWGRNASSPFCMLMSIWNYRKCLFQLVLSVYWILILLQCRRAWQQYGHIPVHVQFLAVVTALNSCS